MCPIVPNTTEIILASGSPRRRDYLQRLGLLFRVETADIVECPKKNESPTNYTLRLAREKAEAVAGDNPAQWILAADTVVCCDEHILEKPKDENDALQMLFLLRNREHIVHSSICLLNAASSVAEFCTVTTIVTFWDFPDEAAVRYVRTKEPFDKAGAYGIQDKGAFLVRKINGSYSNVVGLPLVECIEMMRRCGIIRI